MSATLLPQGRQRYFGNDGLPLAGGKLYPYAAGTSTPKIAYQDADGTVPWTHPIILDAKGEAVIFWDGPYKIDLKASDDTTVTGWPVDNLRTDPYGFAAAIAASSAGLAGFIASLAASAGSSLVGFIAAGLNAVARTLQDKCRERVSVEDYVTGAMGSDWTVAFQRAIAALPNGGIIEYCTPGTVNLTAGLNTSDSSPIIIRGKGTSTAIKKMFNGDMFNLGKKSELRDMLLDGNGATFTGRGVIATTGAVDLDSWRRIHNVQMINMKGYPVEFTAAVAGYGSVISECYLGAVDATTAGVKLPAAEANGNRQMVMTYTSGPMFDAAGCNNHLADDCEGAAPILTASSVKVRMTGCRVPFSPSVPTFTVDGVDTTITSCIIGTTGVTFNATMNNCIFGLNNFRGTAPAIIDNANGTNQIDISSRPATQFTPVWGASGGAPAIGNGSLGGLYAREGQYCHATIAYNQGTTTSAIGTDWTFTMPYNASRLSTGAVFIRQSATGVKYYVGSAIMVAGSNLVQISNNGSTLLMGTASPAAAWAAGDFWTLDITYPIQ